MSENYWLNLYEIKYLRNYHYVLSIVAPQPNIQYIKLMNLVRSEKNDILQAGKVTVKCMEQNLN